MILNTVIEPLAKILKYFTNGVSKNGKIYPALRKTLITIAQNAMGAFWSPNRLFLGAPIPTH